eukprot:GEMP01065171.1.p1 GENE.GEMP01065171.1~~GEMP01065171.1.p1  ORF type:complete len:310 (+),score=64.07 GEMP01065171.1:291-1220(+)
MVLSCVFLGNDGDIPHGNMSHDLHGHYTTAFATLETSPGNEGDSHLSFWQRLWCWVNPFCSSESHAPDTYNARAHAKREKIAHQYTARADDFASRNAEKLGVTRYQKEKVPTLDESDDNRLLSIYPRVPIDDVERKVDMPPVSPEVWSDTHGQAAMSKGSFRTIENLIKKAAAVKEDLTKDMTHLHGFPGSDATKTISSLCNDISNLRHQLDVQADNCIKSHSNFKVQLALSTHDDHATQTLPRMWCTTVLKKLNHVDQMVKDTCNGTFTMHLARDKNMDLMSPVDVVVGEPHGPPIFELKRGLDVVDQ